MPCRRAEHEAERIERRAGQFEELVASFQLHGEIAVEHEEIVRHFTHFDLIEIVLIKWLRCLQRKRSKADRKK